MEWGGLKCISSQLLLDLSSKHRARIPCGILGMTEGLFPYLRNQSGDHVSGLKPYRSKTAYWKRRVCGTAG
ncbi:hypothetical protein MGYG_04318 [Nannizzia gypsea CBS 118893]|uniref:Uncharacterized protein n=1 Tax=Arthroderma gypseum (strain ATCC MYA-4604 / CBS 118893) TaxID=535722 RepID=E4USA7_ARTGP|nr:hypothetical protein MGYG_04318 [Nannizzia gypsea CBS 118893]EFR01311.1 hypothetical protein MGYG_04318 [Nannizzia gypsea CBS 118893]